MFSREKLGCSRILHGGCAYRLSHIVFLHQMRNIQRVRSSGKAVLKHGIPRGDQQWFYGCLRYVLFLEWNLAGDVSHGFLTMSFGDNNHVSKVLLFTIITTPLFYCGNSGHKSL